MPIGRQVHDQRGQPPLGASAHAQRDAVDPFVEVPRQVPRQGPAVEFAASPEERVEVPVIICPHVYDRPPQHHKSETL